ncbi:protein of unknown function [Pedococcus cremeus]|uniref:Protein-glutamine gamma-glutamyltransferase-like C-terminal domain-containing protein n=1 Tax=Pedococcus cremeus TaxID=587636 RepID=A0A1H9X8G4_9MICO|nr:DUF4129 domain-containing protein [Pedococcus cremeus]SES42425.1 protein of unknown function [Pedococcus cremeus]
MVPLAAAAALPAAAMAALPAAAASVAGVPARAALHVAARLDPGNGEARRWLEEELSRPAYHEHNDPIARALAALERFIDSLLNADPSAGGALPAGIAGLVTAGLVALVLFALRHVRREARRGDVGGPALLGEERLTAEQFRERSRRALDEGRFADAVLDAMRATAQGAAERTLLDDAPSLTAHEVGLQLAVPFPEHRDELARAADLFDAVAYGHHAPEREQAEHLLALEATLRRTRPATRQPVAAGGAS